MKLIGKIGITAAMALLSVAMANGESSGNKAVPAKPAATFSSLTTGYDALDPATVGAFVQVTNTSKVSGKPSCTVAASSANNSYTGWDSFDVDHELKPGEAYTFKVTLTVSGQGAQYITRVVPNCS